MLCEKLSILSERTASRHSVSRESTTKGKPSVLANDEADSHRVVRTSTRIVAFFAAFIIVLTSCASLDDAGAKPSPEPRGSGSGVYDGPQIEGIANPFGARWHWNLVEDVVDDIADISGGATYSELEWCEVEPRPGEYDWDRIDGVVASVNKLGFESMLKIRVGSCWVTGADVADDENRSSEMPLDLNAYGNFVRAVVSRFRPRGVKAYSIENQADLKAFWSGSRTEYAELLRAGSASIKSAAADAVVLDSGLSSTTYGYAIAGSLLAAGSDVEALEFFNTYFERWVDVDHFLFKPPKNTDELRAILSMSDVVRSLEFFDTTLALQDVTDVFSLRFFEPWTVLDDVLVFLHARIPQGRPIEAWGVGIAWPGTNFDAEVARVDTVKLLATGTANGLTRMVWEPAVYRLDEVESEQVFRSLWRGSGLPRPTGKAFSVMTHAAAGESVKTVAIDGPGFTGVAYGRAEDTALVIWADSNPVFFDETSTIDALDIEVVSLVGEPLEWPKADLIVGREPVVINVAAPIEQAIGIVEAFESTLSKQKTG